MNDTKRASAGDRPTVRAVLWATAALLTAGILLRAGGVSTFERTASADMIGASGDYTAMTTNGGVEELLFLVDGRNETLMVYRVQNGRQVQLMERQDLRNLFTTARAAYLGAAPGQGRP